MNIDPTYNPYAPPANGKAFEAFAFREGDLAGDGPSYQAERRKVWLLVFFSVISLGIYPAIWFVRRRHFLDSLQSSTKLGPMAFLPLVAILISFALTLIGVPGELDRALTSFIGIASLVTAFRVANILRSDFARTGRFLKVSGLATFFFGSLYLQYKLNQAADTRPHQPTAARAQETDPPPRVRAIAS